MTKVGQENTSSTADELNSWIRDMKELSKSVDISIIDAEDERTQYVMSGY